MPIAVRLTVDSRSGDAPELELIDPILVVAGFTGRIRAHVEEHMSELEEVGIPRPTNVPSWFVVPNWLLQVDPGLIEVSSPQTSGEVEPVLIRGPDDDLYVTVGSDHTDRNLERLSYGAAKAACPKIIARHVWPFSCVEPLWDDLVLSSTAGGGKASRYQNARASCLLEPLITLDLVGRSVEIGRRPLVLFLGTVPLLGSLCYSSKFDARITASERELSLSYRVRVFDPVDAATVDLSRDGDPALGGDR